VKQPWGQLSVRRVFPAKSAGWASLLFFVTACSLNATDLPLPVTLNLPIPINQATPAWLGHPETPATYFAGISLPILTPDPNASLLVTVFFTEKPGGSLRITWKGTQGAQVLSDNFYEDIAMANQRSLIIAPATLVGDGVLNFQSTDFTLGITKIKLEWLEGKTELVSPEVHDVTVTSADGQTQFSQDLSGQTESASTGMWEDQVVSVPLTDAPVRIEQGVDFSVDLDKVPGTARLSLKEAGLPLGKHIVVWINDQRAGIVSPSVPDLLDEGFSSDANASSSYTGWRDASFYVPVSLLTAGVNSVEFTDEDDVPTSTSESSGSGIEKPLAIKGMALQLSYEPPGPKSGLTQPQFWNAPSEPISPDSSSTPSASTIP
jgi:hypothetical protein